MTTEIDLEIRHYRGQIHRLELSKQIGRQVRVTNAPKYEPAIGQHAGELLEVWENGDCKVQFANIVATVPHYDLLVV